MTMSSVFLRCALAWILCAPPVFSLLGAVEQPNGDAALQAWALQAKNVTPTVTKEMGDKGGKFFGKPLDEAKARHYYIAAELEAWDFAPERRDVICGKPLPPQVESARVAMKIRYVQYTDATFTSKLIQNSRLGVLGPVLRGVVGETLAITFLNRTDYPLSMHPHGVKYDKDSEGAYYQPGPGLGSAVGPGAKFTYVWQLDESSGPQPGEASSKCWLYHSHVSGDEEANLGLIGFIIVTDPKRARPDGTPNDVDREMASLFMIFSESGFSEAEEEAIESGNQNGDAPLKSWADAQQELELGSRYAINGQIFGNLSGLEMNEGERVRWYLLTLGDERDMHTAHWHGLRVLEENRRRTDVVELLPATMKVADMAADNPGTWLFHCHVAEHMKEGMFARMIVHPKNSAGVSRAPEQAFFGLRNAERSLRIDRAELTLDTSSGAAQPSQFRLHGSVTVFDAFSIFTAPVRLQIGKKSVTLTPPANGKITTDGVNYRVLNSGRYGVVYGGMMEFEAIFSNPTWLDEVKSCAGTPAQEQVVSLQMQVGESTHSATVPVVLREKGK